MLSSACGSGGVFPDPCLVLGSSPRNSKAHATAIVFDLQGKDSIGILSEDGKQRQYCCDKAMQDKYDCELGNPLIVPKAGGCVGDGLG